MFRTHAYLQEAQFPSRLGFEAAGIVKTVGTSFKKGDVVSLIPPPDISLIAKMKKLGISQPTTANNVNPLTEDWNEKLRQPATE